MLLVFKNNILLKGNWNYGVVLAIKHESKSRRSIGYVIKFGFPSGPNTLYLFIDPIASLYEYKWIDGTCEQFSLEVIWRHLVWHWHNQLGLLH